MSCNGWSNYATWNCALWVKNDQIVDVEEARKSDDPVTTLADALEAVVELFKPELNGLYKDLLENAISSINYREIAENLLS